jgi:trans-aconitate 2-methyltransferase
MTEWNASGYDRISALQAAMAEEALSLLDFRGTESVLDIGCGNGKITSEIAARVPRGRIVGVDASAKMIAFATEHAGSLQFSNLEFAVADARHLAFNQEFDRVVSFNALHWIPEQALALESIRAAIKPSGVAQLRQVSKGARKSLENVIEETRLSPQWERYFQGFRNPYLHLSPEQYEALAKRHAFTILRIHTADKSWDFQSRSGFVAFGTVTFVEWTQHLPEAAHHKFINDVLDRYQKIACTQPGEENYFRFYQMDITLAPS